NDTLTGGAGADSFNFTVAPGAANADAITDFASGTDKIHLDALVMNALGTGGTFASGDVRFYAASGASGGHDADDRVVYDTTGGAGNDSLSGNAGNDWLEGGAGNDQLNGGGDQDSFAFRESGATNADVVTDFAGNWDKIQLDAAGFSAIGSTGRFAAGDVRFYAAAGATGGHDADDRVVYNTSNGQLFYDADGSGSGAEELIA